MTYQELKDLCNKRSSGASTPTKQNRSKGHPEDDLQMNCVRWFRDSFPELSLLLFHPNNEAFFGFGKDKVKQARAGQRAKDMGVVPGVADLVLLYPSGVHHGLMVEMKTKVGRQSESQKEWQKVVTANGYRYEVCRTIKEFRELIRNYTGIEPVDQDEAAAIRLFGNAVKVHGVGK